MTAAIRSTRPRAAAGAIAAAAGLAGLLVAQAPAALALPAPQGHAWPAVQGDVDDLAEDLVEDFDLPGVQIAASKDGRLVVSRAYGFADTEEGTVLGADQQIQIGSNTKPLITGPAVSIAMAEAGLDPQTTPLYGPLGVLGTRFDEDIEIGAAATGTPVEWYYDITVQHLLDHRSGIGGSGDVDATLELFDTTYEDVTYAQVHQQYVRTQGLVFEPGTGYDYSNHGFGSLSMVIEELSGQDFEAYVTAELLTPLGLQDEIVRNVAAPGPTTATLHEYVDGEPVPYEPVITHTLGGAAGGYRASAQDVVELMNGLAAEYTPNELDSMGWGSSGLGAGARWGDPDDGVLTHNGRLKGGTSHVRMTVDGIAVAVQTNINNRDATLSSAAAAVVDLLRATDIPAHYDIWTGCTLPAAEPGNAQVARHGVPAGRYQCLVDQMVAADYRPDWVDAFDVDGTVAFNALFVPDTGGRWSAFHGLTGSGYQDRVDDLVDAGYRPGHVDSYLSGGQVRYAGFFVKESGPRWVAYHGIEADENTERFDELTADGYRPTSMSVVDTRSGLRYTAVYEQGVPGTVWVKTRLTPAQYQEAFDEQRDLGRQPVYLNGYSDRRDGSPRLVAIFASEPGGAFRARHGLTSTQYQSVWADTIADGYRTAVVTGYDGGAGARYAAVWTRR
jgi:CubicO group peptidase (beta-lactamase class C family)